MKLFTSSPTLWSASKLGFHWIPLTSSFSPWWVPFPNSAMICCFRSCSIVFWAFLKSLSWTSIFCCWSAPPVVGPPLICMQSAPFGFSKTNGPASTLPPCPVCVATTWAWAWGGFPFPPTLTSPPAVANSTPPGPRIRVPFGIWKPTGQLEALNVTEPLAACAWTIVLPAGKVWLADLLVLATRTGIGCLPGSPETEKSLENGCACATMSTSAEGM